MKTKVLFSLIMAIVPHFECHALAILLEHVFATDGSFVTYVILATDVAVYLELITNLAGLVIKRYTVLVRHCVKRMLFKEPLA